MRALFACFALTWACALAVDCTISGSNSCPINQLTPDATNLIYPGGMTSCIKHNSGPFAFQVVPRNLSKIHFYFQGGGACWDKATTWVPACSTKCSPEGINGGIFDGKNAQNPYADFTVVAVLYCSGDVHVGNATQPYDDEPDSGYPAKQFGAINTRAVLDWVKSQNLQLSQLLVSGSSAGALGTQTWAKTVLTELPAVTQSVIVDSYAGVLPCQGPIIHHWGVCASELARDFPEYILRKCNEKYLDVFDIVPNALVAFPEVPFAFLQSKYDATQEGFESGVAATCLDNPVLTDSDFYAWSNELFEVYVLWKNFQVFFVDANHHVYLTGNDFYTATTTGTSGSKGGPKMIDFVTALPTRAAITSQCNGGLKNRNDWTGTDYCSINMFPRSFTRPQ